MKQFSNKERPKLIIGELKNLLKIAKAGSALYEV
jgi:hypothetical protein